MLKGSKKILRDCRGFTLIELVLVIAIIGILAAVAMPKMAKIKKTAEITAHNVNVSTLESAANMYIVDKGVIKDVEIITVNGSNGDKLKEFIQEPPKVPNSIKKDNSSGEYYIVKIEKDGKITVEPKKKKQEK